MGTFLAIFKSLPVLYKFWGEIKLIIGHLQKMKSDADRAKFFKNLRLVSDQADETADTSGYEDIIRGGRSK